MRNLIFPLLFAVPLLAHAESDLAAELKALMRTGESQRFVRLGGNMKSMLMARAEVADTCSITLSPNDAPYPIGDGSATQHALIACADYQPLGLRLKRDGSDHYRILGFWTVNAP